MFTIRWLPGTQGTYQDLKKAAEIARKNRLKKKQKKASKQEGLFKQVHKCIGLLRIDPKHPGLHTHEFESLPNPLNPKEKVWVSYAQNNTPGAYRVFWVYGPGKNEITIIAITPHP